jgi:primosomal protein N' (replication factor Y)
VLDAEPILFSPQLKLWDWVAQYYLCTEGEVMAAALPAHFKLSSETILVFNEEYGDDFSALDHDEFLVAEALLVKKELKLSEVQQILTATRVYPVIKRLIEKKLCFVWESLKESYKPKIENFIRLNPAYANEDELSKLLNEDARLQRATRQMELLLSYLHLAKTEGEVTKSGLLKKSGASDAQLKGLVDKGVLLVEKRNINRITSLPERIVIDFELTPEQFRAFGEINAAFKKMQTCLLHGITSSGKTEIYIRMIEQFILTGKQVLYLLPEIALTSQIIRRLQKHFGGNIGVYHSKFSQNERIEIWNKVRSGDLKIVLGARSALFMPFDNLGLIIVDEEHDPSYKQQEPAPRYHARDAAVYYASLFDAKVLLGSATPSIETYYNASTGKYGLVSLMERFGHLPLPAIEIIDAKKFPNKDKTKPILTPPLIEAITQSLSFKKQIILFQNRRGYSPYQVCQVCGWIPQCQHCDVSLTYHKLTHKLQCHYCGTIYPAVSTCAACGNHKFAQRNFGTERIEEHLEEVFPQARIARMDIDSVRGKNAHENMIQLFEQQRIDILVGTQMVVKGLDFENVNLVGILDADSLMHFADFRVHERAFQLMEQVSGRAGRKAGDGRVMVQVADTKHPLLQYVISHNYPAFFSTELEARKRFFYPPYSRIILIQFRHKLKEVADAAAALFALNIKNEFEKWMVGPAAPVVGRVRNLYLMELLLKLPKDAAIIHLAKQMIQQQIIILHHHAKFRSVVILPDVDAV